MSQLRAALADSNTCISGVDILTGTIGDMSQRGITECYRVKQQILLSATRRRRWSSASTISSSASRVSARGKCMT